MSNFHRLPPQNPKKIDPISRLIFEFSKLPGVGEKTAARLAYHVLRQDIGYSRDLAQALIEAKERIRLCEVCFQFTDEPRCQICLDSQRNPSLICVVERPSDIHPIEQTGQFRGVYHVLHGLLSPLDGIGPEQLKIRELLHRLASFDQSSFTSNPSHEVILAMNPSVEGDATALYLQRLIKPLTLRLDPTKSLDPEGSAQLPGFRVTQLAHGIPVGGALEYADRQTLGKAFSNRMEISSR
jgi:recombination protein RecR